MHHDRQALCALGAEPTSRETLSIAMAVLGRANTKEIGREVLYATSVATAIGYGK